MATTGTKVTDPVCGMSIDPTTAAGSSDYQGKTYYFCSVGCKTKFDATPERFTGQSGAARNSTGG